MNGADERNVAGERPRVAEIAKWVLGVSGAAILAICALVLIGAPREQFERASQLVFNSLLPLLGTWVGTVLAYYFSSKNFESASQSVERLVNLTTEQKLGQMFVEKEMLRPPQITTYEIPSGKAPKDVPLTEVMKKLGGKITRVPIVDDRNVVQYIVHQSGLFKFIAAQAMAGKGATIDQLTLQDLIDDAELKNWISNIVYVSDQASVADAKSKMEQQTGCQDLIVTKTGKKDEPMLGWMTNVEIGRLSKA
ncbi:MAG TPA: CBS domain-containing protein [Thermoanaerobaculia bacterium]|jgi:CBS domain-containing protein